MIYINQKPRNLWFKEVKWLMFFNENKTVKFDAVIPLEHPTSHDRRYLPRWSVTNRILYRKQDDHLYQESTTKNLNCGGVCVHCTEELPLNQEICLTIFLAQDVAVHLQGMITWHRQTEDGYLVGIRFHHLSKKANNLLLEYAFETKEHELQKRWFEGW